MLLLVQSNSFKEGAAALELKCSAEDKGQNSSQAGAGLCAQKMTITITIHPDKTLLQETAEGFSWPVNGKCSKHKASLQVQVLQCRAMRSQLYVWE